MYKTTLDNLINGDLGEGEDGNFYLLRNGERVLYIGISSMGAGYRWFGSSFHSHLAYNVDGKLFGCTSIGRYVVDNLPESLEWGIEFWSGKDLIDFLGDEWIYRVDIPDYYIAEQAERMMIWRLKPERNSSYNSIREGKEWLAELKKAHPELE